MKNNYESVVTLNKDTGEVYNEQLIFSNDEVIGTKILTKRENEKINYLRKKSLFEKQCKSLGGYIHMIYLKNNILFNNINIEKNNITRIIYLSTFMSYENEGLLVQDNLNRNNKGKYAGKKALTREEIQNILNLNDSTFKRFLKNVKDENLLRVEDKKFYVNTEYFKKGEVGKISKDKEYCRLFIQTVRDLYKGCKTTQHKVLANIFQLIPYIHYNKNILCHNPNSDSSKERVRYLSLNEICDLLGISENEGNRTSLAKQLYSFRLTYEEKEVKLLTYVTLDDKQNYFVVNPYIIYRGNSFETITETFSTYFFNTSIKTKQRVKKGKNLDKTKEKETNFDIEEYLNKPLLKVERDNLAKSNNYSWTNFSYDLKKAGYTIELDKINKTTTIYKKAQ